MENNEKLNYTVFKQEDVDKKIQNIITRTNPSMGVEEIELIIREELHNQIFPVIDLKDSLSNFKLYRVTDEFEGFNKNDQSKYSYPPAVVAERQRASIKGHPVFYGAFDPKTALVEMKSKLKPGAKLYLSEWEFNCFNQVYIHPLFISSDAEANTSDLFKSMSKSHEERLREIVSGLEIDISDDFVHPIKRIGDLFMSEGEEYYHITGAYAHNILYRLKDGLKTSILIYPSVANGRNSINMAVHPDLIESEMVNLRRVFELNIDEHLDLNEGIRVHISSRGEIEKDQIIWKVPYFEITKTDVDSVEIKTYNGTVFKGEEALSKTLRKSNRTVKEFVEEEVNKALHIGIKNFSNDQVNKDQLSYEGGNYNMSFILKYDHGNEILTESGYSCIEFLSVPVSWVESYKQIEQVG